MKNGDALRNAFQTFFRVFKSYFHALFILVVCVILGVEHAASGNVGLRYVWCLAILMAIVIWGQLLWMFFMRPFRLDQQLSDTGVSKLVRVAAVVIAVPLLITGMVKVCYRVSALEQYAVYSHDLIYDDNLYGSTKSDSLSEVDSVSLESLKKQYPQTSEQDPPSLFWSVIYHFTDPGNQHMTTSTNGRGWAFLIAILGTIFMGGFLITSLINWIEQRIRKYEEGAQRYGWQQFRKQPVILFIGAHPIMLHTLKKLMEDTRKMRRIKYFVVLTSENIEELRGRLCSAFPEEVTDKIILYSGRITDQEQLKNLPYKSIEEIYLLGEHHNSSHDIHNVECMNFLSDHFTWPDNHEGSIPCHVLFEHQSTFSVFQAADSKAQKNHFEFIPYNYYELWAQHVILGSEVNGIQYHPIEGSRALKESDDEYVHMFVVGMSNMGIALASEVATMAHFPNFKRRENSLERKNRTRITFLDKNMSEEMQFFMSRHKVLFQLSKWRFFNLSVTRDDCQTLYDLDYFGTSPINRDAKWNNRIEDPDTTFHHLLELNGQLNDSNFMDVEWQFIQGGIEDAAVQNYLKEEAQHARLTVAICLPDDVQSSAAALYLPEEVLLKAESVLVYQKGGKDLLYRFVSERMQQNKKLNNIYEKLLPFGMLGACEIRYPMLEFAQYLACAYSLHKEITRLSSPTVGAVGTSVYDHMKALFEQKLAENPNYASDDWMGGKMWARWSNIYNAMSVQFKLRSLGLSLANDEATLKQGLGVDQILFSDECSDVEETKMKDGVEVKEIVRYRRYEIREQAPYYQLAVVEHNRWNIEKLFMGYRPPFREEHDSQNKEELKANFVHKNICSFEQLKNREPHMVDFDIAFIVAIPIIRDILDKKHRQK